MKFRKLTFALILLFFSFSKVSAQSDSLLTLSEVMFFPSAANSEFVEIYNISETDSVDLLNFKIKYQTSAADLIVETNEGTKLHPGGFAIILEGDYDLATGVYSGILPSEALVLKINDNAFGSSGMANTSSRDVRLLNSVDDTLEVYTYSANNSAGISDEKIILSKDNSSSNWSNSLQVNGTPGFRNSVSPLNYDLTVSRISVQPELPIAGDNVGVTALVQNIGESEALSYTVEIFHDENFDSIGQSSERIFSQTFNGLQSGDSVETAAVIDSISIGSKNIIAEVDFNEDENIVNNLRIFEFTVLPKPGDFNDLVINEIMYAPSSSEPEWIEIFNRSTGTMNLKNWKFSDNTSSITITSGDLLISPGKYLVLTEDLAVANFYNILSPIIEVNLPSLNNTGDILTLKDASGTTIDSVAYLPTWGGSLGGRSLERVDADEPSSLASNWGASSGTTKATPGRINSITQKDNDIILSNIFSDPLFPVKGDEVRISAKVKNIGRNSAIFKLTLFEDVNLDSTANTFIEESNNITLSAADSTTFQFQFVITSLQSARAFLAEAFFSEDEDTTNNSAYQIVEPGFTPGSIVINEIMFRPENSEPEWIEFYNNSSNEINLKNWIISDVLTTPVSEIVSEGNLYLPPESYFVITKSFSINNYHRTIPSLLIELNFANLNNDVDGVVLRDNRGVSIDSVRYDENFNSLGGYSLERIKFGDPSTSITNWGASIDIEQSTPGRINSIVAKDRDLSITALNIIPQYPEPGDEVHISAKIFNNGIFPAANFSIQFFAGAVNNLVPLGITTNLNLEPDSTLNIISAESFILNDTMQIAVNILYSEDEDEGNNYAEKLAVPGFAPNTILINEIMYSPDDGEPEWIELINVSTDSINIKDWSVSDLLSTPTKNFIATEDFYIQSSELFIISSLKSFFDTLQNVPVFETNFGTLSTTDGIIIYDFRDAIIDSIKYNPDWGGGKGLSLERISTAGITTDSLNWTTSLAAAGSTPGRSNSIFQIPSYARNDIVINEIMYDPDSDNSEFIEFFNNSDKFIEIGGWTFSDENGNSYSLSSKSLVLPPNQFFVLAADSSILLNYAVLSSNLNLVILGETNLGLVNTGEQILLRDLFGHVIDAVFYTDDWHNPNINITKNKSLERLNPDFGSNENTNWSTSVNTDGATPGKQNSIYTENRPASAKVSISPNPFSPDSDGFEDFCVINYKLSQSIAQLRIIVYDSQGRKVRTLANNQPSGLNGSIIFDGLDESGKPLRIGIYILYIEALNAQSGVVDEMKEVVVVARKL